jgi:hypothetical protein
MEQHRKLAFLDTLTHRLRSGETKTTIYRKATHTDQYLDFQSNHHIKQKIGIINTFKHRIKTLITKERDKKKELAHVKKALKRCGHPNWALNRPSKEKREKEERVERRGKVFLPYVKGTSEKLARIFKRYDLETIHKPSTKLKNILCNKMKDAVHPLDKTGAIYYNDCLKHQVPKKNDYVGETDRVNRERQYEHKVVDHKTAKRSASLAHEEDVGTTTTTTTAPRRSTRLLTEGNTEFPAHVASDTHEKGDLRNTVLCTEENWYRRGVKEAIAIRKIKPTLNKDDGRHHLSHMYDELIRSSVKLKTPRPRELEASEDNNF